MKNIRMTRTCYIGSAEFPKGLVFEKRLIPEGRMKIWEKQGLAVETDQNADVVSSETAVMALAGDDLAKDEKVLSRAKAREAQKQRVDSINAKAKAQVEKSRKAKIKVKKAEENVSKSKEKKVEVEKAEAEVESDDKSEGNKGE